MHAIALINKQEYAISGKTLAELIEAANRLGASFFRCEVGKMIKLGNEWYWL